MVFKKPRRLGVGYALDRTEDSIPAWIMEYRFFRVNDPLWLECRRIHMAVEIAVWRET